MHSWVDGYYEKANQTGLALVSFGRSGPFTPHRDGWDSMQHGPPTGPQEVRVHGITLSGFMGTHYEVVEPLADNPYMGKFDLCCDAFAVTARQDARNEACLDTSVAMEATGHIPEGIGNHFVRSVRKYAYDQPRSHPRTVYFTPPPQKWIDRNGCYLMDCDGPRMAMITDEDCTLTDPPLIGNRSMTTGPTPCLIRAPSENVNMRRAPRVGVWGFGQGSEMIDPTQFGLMRFDGIWPTFAWSCSAGSGSIDTVLPCWGISCCERLATVAPPPPEVCYYENPLDVNSTANFTDEDLNTKSCHQPMQTLDFSC